MKYIMLLCLSAVLFSACGNTSKNSAQDAAPRTYEIPVPPSMLTDPLQRAAYISQHFWDKFDFSDTTDMNKPEFIEQLFANYINVLQHTEQIKAEESIRQMLPKTFVDSTAKARFLDMYEHYLYDPNSPMRDEDLYIPLLRTVIDAPEVDENMKLRYTYQLEIAMKNRVGSKANDFSYTLVSGQTSTLYATRAEYLILFINNPGCAACRDYIDALNAPGVNEMIMSGRLKILAVYPDTDLKEWEVYLPEMPKNWINSYNAGQVIEKDKLYDLRAIPTLYLLDKNKTVLLKDVVPDQVLRYLGNI